MLVYFVGAAVCHCFDLIEKKGKNKMFLKNWRPISLIYVDAKVASKSLALRVRKVLNSLIHSD